MNSLPPIEENDMAAMMNSKMNISDATSMYRAPVPPNSRPYDAEVIKHNNRQVDKWQTSMLAKMGDNNSKIQAARVHPSWLIFAEGSDAQKFHELYAQGRFPAISDETVYYWIDVFSNSTIEQLTEIGFSSLQMGWQTILSGCKLHIANEKWEKIFSESQDPMVWSRNGNHHNKLLKGETMPFGLHEQKFMEMAEKYNAFTRNMVRPRS